MSVVDSSDELAVWPLTLPIPLIDASGVPGHVTLTSSPAEATILRRRRFHSATPTLKVQWVFGINQYADFKAFFLNEIDLGSAEFVIDLKYPFTGQVSTWRVKFTGGYEAIYLEGPWRVAAELELHRIVTAATPAEPVGWVPFYSFDATAPNNHTPFHEHSGFPFYVQTT